MVFTGELQPCRGGDVCHRPPRPAMGLLRSRVWSWAATSRDCLCLLFGRNLRKQL